MKYALTILAALIATPAAAQQQCGPEAPVMQMLQESHGEIPFAEGVSQRGARIVVVVNPETRSYTILAVSPQKIACMVDAGEAFEPAKAAAKPSKEDFPS